MKKLSSFIHRVVFCSLISVYAVGHEDKATNGYIVTRQENCNESKKAVSAQYSYRKYDTITTR